MSRHYQKQSKRGPSSKKSSKQYDQLSSRLAIYSDDRTKRGNWIARIRMDDGSYKIRSTKTDDRNKAIRIAYEIYEDIRLRERHSLPFQDATVSKALLYWQSNDGARLTARRRAAVSRWFQFVLEPFLVNHCGLRGGLESPVVKLTQPMLKAFAGWRINPSSIEVLREHALKKSEGKPERPHYNRKVPSRSTLGLEIGNYNVVIRCAARNSLIERAELMPTLGKTFVDLSSIKQKVRPSINTFTDEQVSAVSKLLTRHYLLPNSRWNRGICKLDNEGNAARRDDGAIASKKGMYVSRVNLYASWFILKNTGMRLSELHSLRWKDVRREVVDIDPEGRERSIYLFRVNESKPMRLKQAMIPSTRTVVGTPWLESIFNLVKTENPKHCSADDYLINVKGRRRSSQNELFKALTAACKTWDGEPIDCMQHESGTPLSLRHLRSWYVSDRLLNRNIPPVLLKLQTGHSMPTIVQFYLTQKPKKTAMRLFGGWGEISESMMQDAVNASL